MTKVLKVEQKKLKDLINASNLPAKKKQKFALLAIDGSAKLSKVREAIKSLGGSIEKPQPVKESVKKQ